MEIGLREVMLPAHADNAVGLTVAIDVGGDGRDTVRPDRVAQFAGLAAERIRTDEIESVVHRGRRIGVDAA